MSTVAPKQRPEHVAVSFGDRKGGQCGGLVPFEATFVEGGLCHGDRAEVLVEEHQPVRFAVVRGLRDDACEVEIFRLGDQARFLPDFADGAGGGAFAQGLFELTADRRVKVAIGVLAAMQQENAALFVEEVAQHGDLVGQLRCHVGMVTGMEKSITRPSGEFGRERGMGRWEHVLLQKNRNRELI